MTTLQELDKIILEMLPKAIELSRHENRGSDLYSLFKVANYSIDPNEGIVTFYKGKTREGHAMSCSRLVPLEEFSNWLQSQSLLIKQEVHNRIQGFLDSKPMDPEERAKNWELYGP